MVSWQRGIVVAWSGLEILFFGGVLYGWPSLVYVLRSEGYFWDDACSAAEELQLNMTTSNNNLKSSILPISSQRRKRDGDETFVEKRIEITDPPRSTIFSNSIDKIAQDLKNLDIELYNETIDTSSPLIKTNDNENDNDTSLELITTTTSTTTTSATTTSTTTISTTTKILSQEMNVDTNISSTGQIIDEETSVAHSTELMTTSMDPEKIQAGMQEVKEQFAEKCRDDQARNFNLVFAISTCVVNLLAVVNGLVMDKYGLRVCRLVSIAMVFLSCMITAFTGTGESWLLYISFLMLTYGGNLLMMSNMPIANLFPKQRSTLITFFDGCYDASAFVFLLLKLSYDNLGTSVRTSFLIFAFSVIFLIISLLAWLPETNIPWPLPRDYQFPIRNVKEIGKLLQFYKPSKESDMDNDIAYEQFNNIDDSNGIDGPNGNNSNPFDDSTDSGERQSRSRSKQKENTRAQSMMPGMGRSQYRPPHTIITPVLGIGGFGTDKMAVWTTMQKPEQKRHRSFDRASLPKNQFPRDTNELRANGFAEVDSTVGTVLPEMTPDDNLSSTNAAYLELTPSERFPNFRDCLFSPIYMWTVFWCAICRMDVLYFIGPFNSWIDYIAENDEDAAHKAITAFSLMQFLGLLIAPLGGIIMDYFAKKHGNSLINQLRSARPAFILNSFFAILTLAIATVRDVKIQYATFACHVIQRAFLYGPGACLIAQVYPSQHFGKLFGGMLCVAAVCSLFQYPLFLFRQYLDGNPLYPNLIAIVLTSATFGQPIYLTVLSNRLSSN
ncbi:hypothetical protein SNEBB_005942 [Seison nebaliae]|nr:hypothetical protein SNEBB_005942 [Seison nebaliae]